jgi:hypothetical protein
MSILIVVLGTALCAALYRFGGAGKKQDGWDWLRFNLARDWGCALVVIGMLLLLGVQVAWYWHVLAFLGMWGALSTYLDDIFGYDNFFAHGLLIGLACLPYAIGMGGGDWWLTMSIRAGFMGVFMGLWCAVFSNDIVEECGRGAVIAATVPMLFITLNV